MAGAISFRDAKLLLMRILGIFELLRGENTSLSTVLNAVVAAGKRGRSAVRGVIDLVDIRAAVIEYDCDELLEVTLEFERLCHNENCALRNRETVFARSSGIFVGRVMSDCPSIQSCVEKQIHMHGHDTQCECCSGPLHWDFVQFYRSPLVLCIDVSCLQYIPDVIDLEPFINVAGVCYKLFGVCMHGSSHFILRCYGDPENVDDVWWCDGTTPDLDGRKRGRCLRASRTNGDEPQFPKVVGGYKFDTSIYLKQNRLK